MILQCDLTEYLYNVYGQVDRSVLAGIWWILVCSDVSQQFTFHSDMLNEINACALQ